MKHEKDLTPSYWLTDREDDVMNRGDLKELKEGPGPQKIASDLNEFGSGFSLKATVRVWDG